MQRLAALCAVAFFLNIPACLAGGQCTSDSDCSGDDVCSGGTCVQCDADSDCSGGATCTDHRCVGGGEGEGEGEGEAGTLCCAAPSGDASTTAYVCDATSIATCQQISSCLAACGDATCRSACFRGGDLGIPAGCVQNDARQSECATP